MYLWRGNARRHVLLPLVPGRLTACVVLARIVTNLIGMPYGGAGALWKPV